MQGKGLRRVGARYGPRIVLGGRRMRERSLKIRYSWDGDGVR